MFNIKEVKPLLSKTGMGIKIGNVTVGCAKISSIDLPEDTTLEKVAQADGLVLRYSINESNGDGSEQKPTVAFDSTNISGANNYVLVLIADEDTETPRIEVITDASQITTLFNLPDTDSSIMDQYIGELADRGQLTKIDTEDLEGNHFFFFVNKIDEKMMDLYYEDEQEALLQNYIGMTQSPEFMAEYSNDDFIKMLMVGIIKASQDRYNFIHRDQELKNIANMMTAIRYWNDGALLKPSVKDIEDFMVEVKNQIVVQ